jgi:hypothetical protein
MKAVRNLIEGVISSVDWLQILNYHKKLNILWEFKNDKEITLRIPEISELKEELRSLLWHMHTESLSYLSYANWVVFWEDEDGSVDVRAIFRVADFHYGKTRKTENLEEELKKALEREDYEKAAFLRDIKRKQK